MIRHTTAEWEVMVVTAIRDSEFADLSTREISDRIGESYSATRTHVAKLEKRGRIQPTRTVGKATMYSVADDWSAGEYSPPLESATSGSDTSDELDGSKESEDQDPSESDKRLDRIISRVLGDGGDK